MALKLEAWVGIEPTIELLQSSALPLGDHALKGSNKTWFLRERSRGFLKVCSQKIV